MPTMEKIDLFKQHKADYVAKRNPVLVEIAETTYLAIEFQGAPGGPAFTDAVGALYAIAYTVKMTRKAEGLGDYVICKLESLMWVEAGDPALVPKDQWHWRLLIRTPEVVSPQDLERASEVLLSKGKPAGVRDVYLTKLTEGLCVQMLHQGSYESEGDTIAPMTAFAEEKSLTFHSHHHEIYLSDPRRVPPERLKTILRHPVRPATL